MHEKERTRWLESSICNVIDRTLILVDSKYDLNTLIGIKLSILERRDSGKSHLQAVESILTKLSTKKFPVEEIDRLRLKEIILPRVTDLDLGWDSASKEVDFWDALELFESDLAYLRSKELTRYLPAPCIAARDQVLANIRTTRLHPKFGTGSKVSYGQYRWLVRATAGGWMAHLAEQGSSKHAEPVHGLGPPKSNEDDQEPLCEGSMVERTNNYEQGTTNT